MVMMRQQHNIGKSWGFLGRLLGRLLKIRLSLIGNVLKPLDKTVLILLGLTTPETDPAIFIRKYLDLVLQN